MQTKQLKERVIVNQFSEPDTPISPPHLACHDFQLQHGIRPHGDPSSYLYILIIYIYLHNKSSKELISKASKINAKAKHMIESNSFNLQTKTTSTEAKPPQHITQS